MRPTFKTEISDSECICPYCKYSYQVEAEDYSEDTREEECFGCGKIFYHRESFSVDHITDPDCELNGEEHDFERIDTRSGPALFCNTCNKCKVIPT